MNNDGEEEKDKFKNILHLDGDCQIMWHLAYWDGPQSGVIMYDGEMCFFDMIDQYVPDPVEVEIWETASDEVVDNIDLDKWYRKHAVYSLSTDDKIRLMSLHALWQAHVGLHTDYWPINGRAIYVSDVRNNKKNELREVSVLHFGPTGDSGLSMKEYDALKKHWSIKHGSYSVKGKKPIGFIYHDQLFGHTVLSDGTTIKVETDEEE